MSQPPPAFDPCNPLLGKVPCRLDTAMMSSPDGEKLGIITVRTQSGESTVFLDAAELRDWADLIDGLAKAVGGNGVLAAATMADVITLGRQPR